MDCRRKRTGSGVREKACRTPKKRIYAACALVFAIGLLVIGVTLAYFSSRDEVTNRIQAKDISIRLLEPRWYAAGLKDAQIMQPGMAIEKDPQVYNSCEADVYVRMKLVISVSDPETGEYTDFDMEEYASDPSAFSDSALEDRFLSILAELYCGLEEDAVPLLGESGESQNPSFYLDGGWFYYAVPVDGTADAAFECTVLRPGEYTPALFDAFVVPVLKSEYGGKLDSAFQITVVAQAISTELPTDENGAAVSVQKAFETDYKQVTDE